MQSEGKFRGNPLLDVEIKILPLYSGVTIDFHVTVTTELHLLSPVFFLTRYSRK
jgi:hypothetical protein